MLLPLIYSFLLLPNIGSALPVVNRDEPLSLHMNKTDIYAIKNHDFKINCKASAQIQKCIFQFRNSTFDVPDGHKDVFNFSYVGDGFENGDCGIEIEGRENLEGNVTCRVQLKGSDTNLNASGTIDVDDSPGEAVLKSNSNEGDYLMDFTEGQQMKFYCKAEFGKNSMSELKLGNETLSNANSTNWSSASRNAAFLDNGRIVICSVTHPAFEDAIASSKRLNVFYKPRAVEELQDGTLLVPNSFLPGKTGILSFEITANPNLTSVNWTVNGTEVDRNIFQPWSIEKSQYKRAHTWLIGMNVDSNFTEEDSKSHFQVHLTNEIGNSTLTVKIFTSENKILKATKQSSTPSEIVFLVLGIVVPMLIIIAAIVIYFKSRKYAEDGVTTKQMLFLFLEDAFVRTESPGGNQEDLKNAQLQEKVTWSDDFVYPEKQFLNDLCKHAAKPDNENFGEWNLVDHVKTNILIRALKLFEGKLYYHPVKRQLVLVFLNNFRSIEVIGYFSNSAAVKFGERVRLLVNKFKVRPLVLATGEGVGGHLAQLVTYSMKNLRVQEGEVRNLDQKEKGVHMHTVVFESPPAFSAIQKMAKETLDQDSLRLAITNYISDEKLIECCASQGPHVGKVVFVKEMEATYENQEQVELLSENEQVLSNVGSLNLNYNKFSVEDLKEVESFEWVKKEEENNSIPWFFFDKNEAALLEAQKDEDSVKLVEIPLFEFSGNLKYILLSDVEFREFVAKVRFYKSQPSPSVLERYTTDFSGSNYKLNRNLIDCFNDLKHGSVLTGFSSEQEIKFVAQLIQNSIPDVHLLHQSKFLQLSSAERSEWLKKEGVVFLLIVERDEDIKKFGSEGCKIVHLASSTEVLGSTNFAKLLLNSLDGESATKFKSELLLFFGQKVSVSEIFTQKMFNDLTLMEILNFRCDADVKPRVPRMPQIIRSDSKEFKSVRSFAGHLLSLEGQTLKVISSGAGMGKTRYLEQLCDILRSKKPSEWTSIINLKQFCDKLIDFKSIAYSESDKQNALELVCKAVTSTDASNENPSDITSLERDIKCKVLSEKIKSGNAWILLDSFDEVCPSYKQQAKFLIGLLRGMRAHLLVATRPNYEITVMNALQSNEKDILRLNPLEEARIRKFLSSYPHHNETVALGRILEKDSTQFKEIIKIPRFLHLASSAVEKLKSSDPIIEAELVSTIVEKSLEFTLNDKIELKASIAAMLQVRNAKKRGIRDLHCKLALDAVFNQRNCDWISQEEADEVNVFDLAYASGGKVSFQHIHFALFLCAQHLLEAILSPGQENNYATKKELNEVLIKEEHRNLRKMMDRCCNLEFARGKRADKNVGKELNDKVEKLLRNILCENLLSLFKFTFHWYDPKKKIKIQGRSEPPLYWAFKMCSKEFKEYLIDQGARPNSPWFSGQNYPSLGRQSRKYFWRRTK